MDDSRRDRPAARRAPLIDSSALSNFTIISQSIPPELTNGLAQNGGNYYRPEPNFSVSNAADAGDEIKQIDPHASLTPQQRLQLFRRTGGQGRTFTTSSEPNTQTWSDGSNNNDTNNIPLIVNKTPPPYKNSYGDEQSLQTSDLSYTNTYQAAAAAQAAQSSSNSSRPSTKELTYQNYPEIIVKSNGHVTQPDWEAWSKVTTQAVNLSSEVVDKRPADAAQFYNPITHSPTLDRIKNGHDKNDNISTEEITEQVENNIRIINELDNEYKTILERWHDFNGNINTSTAKIKELNFNSDIQYSISRSLYELALRPENYQFDYLKNFFPNIEHRDAANNLVSAINDPYSLMKAIYESASNSNPNGPDGHDISAAEPRYVPPVAYTENNASLETFAKNEEYNVSQFDSRYVESNYTLSESDYENLALSQNYNYITMINVGDSDLQDAFEPRLYESSDNSVFKELIELINESQSEAVATPDNFAGRMKEVYDQNVNNPIYTSNSGKRLIQDYVTFFQPENQYPSSFSNNDETISNIKEYDDRINFNFMSMNDKWFEFVGETLDGGYSFFGPEVLSEQNPGDILSNLISNISGYVTGNGTQNVDTPAEMQDYMYKFYSSFADGTSFVDTPSGENILLKGQQGWGVGQLAGAINFKNRIGGEYQFFSDIYETYFGIGTNSVFDVGADIEVLRNELENLQADLENSYLPGLTRINQTFTSKVSVNDLLRQNILRPELIGGLNDAASQEDSKFWEQDGPGVYTTTFSKLYVDNISSYNGAFIQQQGRLPNETEDRFDKGYIAGVPIMDIERQAVSLPNGEGNIPPIIFDHKEHDLEYLVGDQLERGHIHNIPGIVKVPVSSLQPAVDYHLNNDRNRTDKENRSYEIGKEQFFPFIIETDNRSLGETDEEVVCSFQALINTLNETSNPTWQPKHFFGRTEQINTYVYTERNLDLNINIYADTMHELANIKHRVNFLLQQTYGQYNQVKNLQYGFIAAGPIVRLTLGDLYVSLPGIITTLNINWGGPNGGAPTWEMTRGIMMPRICTIQMTYKVLHNEMPHRSYDFYKWTQHGIDGGHEGNGSEDFDFATKRLLGTGDDAIGANGLGGARSIPGVSPVRLR